MQTCNFLADQKLETIALIKSAQLTVCCGLVAAIQMFLRHILAGMTTANRLSYALHVSDIEALKRVIDLSQKIEKILRGAYGAEPWNGAISAWNGMPLMIAPRWNWAELNA